MRHLLVFVMMLCMVGVAAGYEIGNTLPEKGDAHINQAEGSNPRQGGDTIFDATVIGGVPFNDAGTTVGYVNDYDEACPYTGSTSPDVVYSLTPAADMFVDVDLCGSAYDTKVYMYDEGLNLIACNDDFYFDDVCGTYVSKLEGVAVMGGGTYYIVIDGYGGGSGDYLLEVIEFEVEPPCVLECPDGAAVEGEPELMDGYEDLYNGGCNTSDVDPLAYTQVVGQGDFCAISGWHLNSAGGETRDTDWFVITLGEQGFFSWDCDAEQELQMYELLNMPECGSVGVGQAVVAGPCLPANMTIFGAPGSDVYFWAGPTVFVAPGGFIGNEFDYVNYFDIGAIIATEDATWSQLKSMYR